MSRWCIMQKYVYLFVDVVVCFILYRTVQYMFKSKEKGSGGGEGREQVAISPNVYERVRSGGDSV